MSATEARRSNATSDASTRTLDMKLKVVVIPVSDIERAKEFYQKRIGKTDPNWPDWYAAYMVAEQTGENLPV